MPDGRTNKPAAETLDRATIRSLVERFYEHVHRDALLAPIFQRVIEPDDWPGHLDQMTEFWSTTLLATATYRGDAVGLHASIDDLAPEHFDRWVELFSRATHELFVPDLAANLMQLVEGIRTGLERQTLRRRDGGALPITNADPTS